MKLSEALDYFQKLVEKTNDTSESRIYQVFANILSNLNNRGLTAQQLNAIEIKLETLDLSTTTINRKKDVKRKLHEFKTFLKKEFSFTTSGYYTSHGMVFGIIFGSGIGLTLGTAFGAGSGTAIGLSMGTGIGMTFGMLLGAAKDAEAKKQNRVV